jgi:hypothetical protein
MSEFTAFLQEYAAVPRVAAALRDPASLQSEQFRSLQQMLSLIEQRDVAISAAVYPAVAAILAQKACRQAAAASMPPGARRLNRK